MNTIKNTKANTSASAKATTAKAYFTTTEVAEMLGISRASVTRYVQNRPELCPNKKNSKGRHGTFLWSQEEIRRLIEYRSNDNRIKTDNTANTETTIAIPETNKTTAISTNTTTPETLIAMFDAFLEIEQEEQKSENRAANRKFRYLFENMSETDIQNFFKPLTERFKFSYITKVIEDIQSQTLTCIKNGRLKGIDKYKLTYTAFLHLCKFAAENNCPLNIPQTQTM